MVVILTATIFTGCTDDDEKSLSPRCLLYTSLDGSSPKM